MDPEEAAKSVNDGRIEPMEHPAELEQATQPGKASKLLDRLKNTEPHKPLDDESLGTPEDLVQNYKRYGVRFLEKIAGQDSRMALFDGLYFAAGAFMALTETTDKDEFDPGVSEE